VEKWRKGHFSTTTVFWRPSIRHKPHVSREPFIGINAGEDPLESGRIVRCETLECTSFPLLMHCETQQPYTKVVSTPLSEITELQLENS
jgi:hypothetical protein